MGKRFFGLALSSLLLALCLPAHAQQAKKIPTVGVLLEGFPSSVSDTTRIEAFREGLREVGYTEGKNISIDYRFAEGKRDRLTALATELVHLKVDVLWDGRDPCCQACYHDDPHCHDEQ